MSRKKRVVISFDEWLVENNADEWEVYRLGLVKEGKSDEDIISIRKKLYKIFRKKCEEKGLIAVENYIPNTQIEEVSLC